MLTSADLLSPGGEVAPGWFPLETVTAPGGPIGTLNIRLDGYLDAAYAELTRKAPDFMVQSPERADDAARQYAYGRARLAVAERLSSEPASLTLADAGSRTYAAEQIKTWKDGAAENMLAWREALLSAMPTVEDSDQSTLRAPIGPQRIVPQW